MKIGKFSTSTIKALMYYITLVMSVFLYVSSILTVSSVFVGKANYIPDAQIVDVILHLSFWTNCLWSFYITALEEHKVLAMTFVLLDMENGSSE
jgi:hypothetical protein